MSELPAALMSTRPKPFRLAREVPAGRPSDKNGDRFRNFLVLPKGRIETYKIADRWNAFDTQSYSSVPLILGVPYDTTKPRKGRWGETLGTKMSMDSCLMDHEWKQMEVSRKLREYRALERAKKDLQKRIEICLYGAPRESPVMSTCPDTPQILLEMQN